ncbi:MAG: hypothetical protein AABY22_36860, partial [Nanoarchaeota archaeon]
MLEEIQKTAEDLFLLQNLSKEEIKLIVDILQTILREFEKIKKAPWMSMMEELSTPEHFKQQSRRFPIH